MGNSSLNRYLSGIGPLAVLAVLVAVALFMMSAATQNSATFSRVYSLLLVVNVIGIVLLLSVILFNLYRLVGQLRGDIMGSRLTLRLLSIFVVLTVIPVLVVYFFSIQLLNRGIDSWFDVRVEQALSDALALGRTSLDAMKDDLIKKTQEMASELQDSNRPEAIMLNDFREQFSVSEVTLFGADGNIIASSSQGNLESKTLIPERPSEHILAQVRQGPLYANLDPDHNGLQLRIVVPVYSNRIGAPPRILQVLQPLADRYSLLGESVQSAFSEYEKLLYLRKPLKFGFSLTLTLVALLALLVAVWAAIISARRLVAPIHDLAEGTRAVAQGNYRKHIPVTSHDELGILVQSFNDMTRKINRAQNQIQRGQREAETQRTYLETILTHLSSGVLSFDPRLNLRTHNSTAGQILGIDLNAGAGKAVTWMNATLPALAPFVTAIQSGATENRNEWHAEVTVVGNTGRRALILRGTKLPGLGAKRGGYVVVFDDITALIQAQRDSAWGEVARRLAHEIKNPLTPIQLSAERIRKKCMAGLADAERETLDRATRTIIQQVEALKSMVNDFSDYARPLQLRAEAVNLNLLIRDMVELYKGKHEAIAVELQLDKEIPLVHIEPGRLRQVLHNLLLNAADALFGHPRPALIIHTHCIGDSECQFVQMQVRDNGPGFLEGVIDHVFEPYVTTKERGTGLGLAIVKKIIEEYSGSLWAENLQQGGACVTVRFPARKASDGAGGAYVREQSA